MQVLTLAAVVLVALFGATNSEGLRGVQGIYPDVPVHYDSSSVNQTVVHHVIHHLVADGSNKQNVSLVPDSTVTPHNLVIGQPSGSDYLAYHRTIVKSPSWFSIFGKKVTEEIQYQTNDEKLVKAIRIMDRSTRGLGGYPYLINGGLGQKKVSILLKSQKGHGLDFTVDIYTGY